MGKAKDAGSDKAWAGKRQHHMDKAVPGRGTQGRGHLQRAFANGAEGVLQWLHDKGHGVDHRADYQACEAEHHGAQPHGLGGLADPAVRAEGQQQVEADNRGGEH
ncbi:hypothetical protein D3C78_1705440 [compost metagenome]